MQEQFIDRILNCVDCRGEFIFTAGEQLFFSDKQFKNDPKRCKPCKSRRSGLSAVANGTAPAAAGLSRTETRTLCSDCGIETTVPFKPTQGRPVLCRQCFQVKSRSAPNSLPNILPQIMDPAIAAQNALAADAAALTEASATADGMTLTPDAALLAAASMSAASPQSSIASAADLASISAELSDLADSPSSFTAKLIAATPAELLTQEVPAELVAAEAQA